MAYWVTGVLWSSPLVGRCSGTCSFRGSSEMTMPAAWVLECRVVPSSPLAVSTRVLMLSSAPYTSRSSSLSSSALSSVMWSLGGTSRAILSTSAYGIAKARPTSRIDARAPRVPKVMIWATCSRP